MHDDLTRYCADQYAEEVHELLEAGRLQAIARGEEFAHLPHIGDLYPVRRKDLFPRHERRICDALAAQKLVSETGPPGLPPLPLKLDDCMKMTVDENNRVVLFGHYGWLVRGEDWNLKIFPLFNRWVCGAMAFPLTPQYLRTDPDLLQEFPPEPLEGFEKGDRLGWWPFETVSQELQKFIRDRQYRLARGMSPDSDWMKWADEHIADLVSYYPSKFADFRTGL